MKQQTYTCSSCHEKGGEAKFKTKILSIIYSSKHDNIQAFKQIKCAECHNLVTIIYETMDNSLTN